ncbi:MAG: 16S rRNA (guanine(527)-N(7))-methyltransferase RsmG [Candidatus Rokuibacteriota bacterium]
MTGSVEATLRSGAQDILGRPLADDQAVQLLKYLQLLVKWQKVQRLVGPGDPATIRDFLLDSLLFTRVLPPVVDRIMDLGSGAGLPGIPLGIVLPSTEITLVEARQKRVSFLSTAIRELGLGAVKVMNSRAENLPSELEQSFDAVVMRCAGSLDAMIPLAARFARPDGGCVIASGPPEPEPLAHGVWTNVALPGRGRARLFAVFKK